MALSSVHAEREVLSYKNGAVSGFGICVVDSDDLNRNHLFDHAAPSSMLVVPVNGVNLFF